MCEKVVSAVLKKDLEITKSSHVATHLRELNKSNVDKTKCVYGSKYPVGLDKLVVNFERECLGRKGDENIVGILGRGGSGKTTLAKGVYNSIVSKYDGSCFLFDVREASASNRLMSLQRKLINDLFHQNHPKFQSINEGTSYFRNCMKRGSSLRFLIVLDDIDCLDQLDALLDRDALNSNSLVIVTTRDKRVLAGAGINSHYNLGTMDKESSTHLFCWNAFGQPLPASEYEDLVDEFVTASGGSPLALKVFGSHVYGRNRNYWALELKKIRVSLPGGIKQRLKISFDSLDSTEQQIFMDIACFFISRPKDMAIRIWEASGWDFEPALQSLQYKSLVEIDDVSSAFRMHDHLRDLGREMAAIVYPHRLWHSQRLKSLELKGFQSTVCELSGQNIRCLGSMFDRSMSSQITFFFGKTDDCDETLTALLWLEMCNYGRKFTSIPSWIPQQNLKFLQIKNATSSERKKHNHVTEL